MCVWPSEAVNLNDIIGRTCVIAFPTATAAVDTTTSAGPVPPSATAVVVVVHIVVVVASGQDDFAAAGSVPAGASQEIVISSIGTGLSRNMHRLPVHSAFHPNHAQRVWPGEGLG